VQPLGAHDHWHVDISYLNLAGTFYYLAAVLDGFSRYIVHWEIRESMTEADVETILQRAAEKYPDAQPRIISRPTFGRCPRPAVHRAGFQVLGGF